MALERQVMLWPTRENYARFAALCDDELDDTFEEFEVRVNAKMALFSAQGLSFDKLAFDPDKMAEWCRANFGKVNSSTRAAYAGFLALSD